MALTSLMTCLHLDRPNGAVLSVARDLARLFDASVVGMAAKQANMQLVARAAGPAEPHGHELGKFRECADAAEREFRETFATTSKLAWRAQLTFGPASEFVAREARAADLVVVSTETQDRFVFPSGCADAGDLLMRLGRPILAVPARVAGFDPGSALVCWKDSREARRAILDAMPLLRVMKRVDVVEIADPRALEDTRASLAELAAWLRGHGVESNCEAQARHGTDAAQLGTLARERGVDLIVAGAFGHSRLREWAFGGVTRDLVLGADCCVLASH